MAWQQLTLRIAASDLPRTEALLRLAGAAAVAIADDGDHAILEPEPGTTPLWPRLSVRALFDADLALAGIEAALGPLVGSGVTIEHLDEAELARAAEQKIEPAVFGPRLELVPAEDLTTARGTALGLHMGLAFGTGQHPTTRLCLEWLARAAIDGATVLDYGCGTGVLALAALKLGAASATAIDNEPQALDATRRNASLNGLTTRLAVAPPGPLPPDGFDLVLANILAGPLIDHAGTFADAQPAGGRIVLSGLLAAQVDEVEARYAHWYHAFERRELAGWALLTAARCS